MGKDNGQLLGAVRQLCEESSCGLDLVEELLLGPVGEATLLRLRGLLERVGALVGEAVELAEGQAPPAEESKHRGRAGKHPWKRRGRGEG